MKTIEEKAKAYDEAAKKIISKFKNFKEIIISRNEFEKIFPELKESEEEKIKNFIANELACIRATDEKGTYRYEELTKAIAWVEMQGEQKSEKKELKKIEKNTTWGEEDNCAIERLFCLLDNEQDNYPQLSCDFQEIEEIKTWLNSLKERYTWKPSDAQMKLLKEACDQHWEPDGLDPLYTLYQDLKKLKELTIKNN